jgi:5'-nucleotidase
MSFNDLHGNLQPPIGSSARVQLGGGKMEENAGGAAYLARHVDLLREKQRHSVLLSTGDSLGASPLPSALFHDEPTVEVLNAMGVRASVVGNHEFDEGLAELRRIEHGGCHPTDGCQFRTSYEGTDFPFLGANVTFESGKPAFQPFSIQRRGGVKIGVIGVTLQDLPDVVTPTAVAGLEFTDEVAAINRTSRLLQRMGVKAQVVLMHQGDETSGTGGPNSCELGEERLAQQIASRASARVDAFFAGHTHQAENCVVIDPAGRPRPLIQGLSFGRLVSVVDLTISTRTKDVIRSRTKAENVIVTRAVEPDPEVQAIVERAETQSAPLGNRPVGSITADVVRAPAASGESPLGNVIADAQLAATADNGAQIAMTNPGGIRADLVAVSSKAGEGDGVVTYGEAYAVQPFGNVLQTITLTGAQLDAVLEQQWQEGGVVRILQISDSLNYTWSTSAPTGSKVSDITVAGQPVDPAASYRVTVNNFLAAGGDGFTVFADGTDLSGGPVDLDALVAYLEANPGVAPPTLDRITVVP